MARFAGALQIIRFNWPYYIVAAVVSAAAFLCVSLWPLPAPVRLSVMFIAIVPIAMAVLSIVVSHYVYDRSDLYRWSWLRDLFGVLPERWVNIHAGLDQTTDALRQVFPSDSSRTWDIFQKDRMTEPAIERARREYSGVSSGAEKADAGSLPSGDGTADAVFVIFAAHEIRALATRNRFFSELYRILRTDGRVVLIEHLRDWPNFLAYGPGVVHFYPRSEWVRLAHESNLEIAKELKKTPFVRCFVLRKP